MSWVAVGTVAVGLYSANQQKQSAKGATNATARAADAATGEQQRQFDLTREDQKPWMEAGQGAPTQMQALNAGDFSSFNSSPDYQFTLDQSLQGLDRSASSRGSLFSGGHSADVLKLAGGLASQNYGNYYNRLADLSGAGRSTASGLGGLGANMATNIGNNTMTAGNARASAYGSVADTNSQLAGGIGGAFNNWYQKNSANNGGGSGWYLGSKPGAG